MYSSHVLDTAFAMQLHFMCARRNQIKYYIYIATIFQSFRYISGRYTTAAKP